MKYIGSLLLFSATALAHPKGLWWGTDFCYPSPDNTDNSGCSVHQQAGFDWSQLANGDNWSFEGFQFNGFGPKDGCRASGGKCIEGKLSRDDDYALQIDAQQAPFSVRKFHLTTSRKTDLIITYAQADGSSCHQVVTASPAGLDVNNDQCGGAISVQFQVAVFEQYGDVSLELHQIGFDCSTGPKPPGPLVATPPHSKPIPHHTTLPVSVEAPAPTSIPPVMTTSTLWSTIVVTVTNCPTTVNDCPAHSTVVTSFTTSSTTVCPASATATDTTKPSPLTVVPSPETVSSALPATISTIPETPETPKCPDIVPKCLNTWLSVPQCDSNSDAACFCPSSDFTAKFKSCVQAWSSSQQETDRALSYFAGICAPYIPGNPDIISLVPTSTASSPPLAPVSTPPPLPSGTIVPITSEPQPPCTTVSWSSLTATVPHVGFSTSTGPSTTVVGLVAGSGGSSGVHSWSSTPTASVPVITPSKSSSTCTSSFTTIITMTSTDCACEETSASSTGTPAQPSDTMVASNSGSKVIAGGFWAFGVTCLFIALL